MRTKKALCTAAKRRKIVYCRNIFSEPLVTILSTATAYSNVDVTAPATHS